MNQNNSRAKMLSWFVVKLICLCTIATTCQGVLYPNQTLIRISRQSDRCQLPHHPRFGQWTIYKQSPQSPGQHVMAGTILQVTCKDTYRLDGDATVVCINGDWSRPIGQCLKTCPSLHSTSIMTVTCTYNERKLETCTDALTGTKATFQCADFYEDQKLERNPLAYCYNGKWSSGLPECIPICGKKNPKDDPTLIVGGKNATKGQYPWQVALYNVTDKELLCGGSLLNPRVILTAAHCVTNLDDGKVLSKEFYMVAVGKYYRKYDHPEDFSKAQFSEIDRMFIPRNYKGDIQNYFGDIAILITKKTFELSLRVLPICVDWGLKHFPVLLDPSIIQHGYVTGWGFTVEYKNPSAVLKELKVPIIYDQDSCANKIPDDFNRYITDDKLCAGFLDQSTAVCKGDSGGALVSKHGNRYYVVAVVSIAPQAPTQEGGCDSQQVALYTKVSYYTNSFILEKEAQFRPSLTDEVPCEEDPNCQVTTTTTTTTTTPKPTPKVPTNNCELPQHPQAGKWSVFGISGTLTPGTSVSPGTILRVTCDKGYHSNANELTLCEKGEWQPELPQCLKSCPPIHSTEATRITCSYNNTEMKDCSNPFDGTIARHTCANFYEDLQLSKNPVRVCKNGTWDLAIPECVPICGQKTVSAQPLIINGNPVDVNEYPWQVAIYRDGRKQFICGGTLISQRLILTAAHCVTNSEGKVEPKNRFTVGVGKLYREYYDPLDHTAQFSELVDISIPLQYSGINSKLFADVAVLITRKSFTLSKRVQPACVDWGLNYITDDKITNRTGYVSGWGYTQPTGTLADKLQYLEVPIVPYATCYSALPQEFAPFLTADKLCGGYANFSKSVCSGDAGGGLVTRHEDRYYITGIISSSPSTPERQCNSETYALYTKVSTYNNFILEKEAQLKSFTSPDSSCSAGETSCTTTPRPASLPEEPIRKTCTLPQHPSFGKWAIFGTSSKYSPGTSVVPGTVLQISCYKNYKLEGDTIILCENGKWSSSIGQCLKTCPPVLSSPQVKATCIIKEKESNCTDPVDGTRVKYECAPFYEDPDLSRNPIHLCQDGSWDRPAPRCIPICGQKSVTPQVLIINGTPAKRGDYPWNVAIYKNSKDQFICGGALISQKLIVTAAHCITDFDGKLYPKSDFKVAVGKYYQKFSDPREDSSTVQFSTLKDMYIHQNYKGPTRNYIANIAILVADKTFVLSPNVQPICVDWDLKYDNELSRASKNLTGFVTGWGFTNESGNVSEELRELQVPIISTQECEEELPQSFISYYTYDKICAGYRNEGKSLCKGDSGGALAVKFDHRFYISGIVAVSPSKGGDCDSQQYSLYTKISSYISDFILPKNKLETK